jgi:glycosyltransferase involved in cell wall biosynthesis
MKIALVHDYLAQDGGAERVLKAFHELWPQAPIFVLFHDTKKITDFSTATITESFLKHVPGITNHFQWYLPLMPLATEKHNLDAFDVVLSSTSAFAKGVITAPHTIHISYCHTPARFLWSDTHHYIDGLPYNRLIKCILPRFISKMRLWDKMSADRVDDFIANSKTVQSRISKYYRRNSTVIHPPVDAQKLRTSPIVEDYFVAGGRLVPYKRIDLVVHTFNRLGWPLKIFGTGPELKRLQKIAKPNITFLGRINDEEKAELLSRASAFIHPQIEDFGITAVESMASGRPVIAFSEGGALETIIARETGLFFTKQNWESLLDTLLTFDKNQWDSTRIREHALQFDLVHFKNTINRHVTDRFEEYTRGVSQPTLV